MTGPAFANGQGSPIEPSPQDEPVALEPSGPAPAAAVQTVSDGTNWLLIGLGAAAAVGLVVFLAEDDDDTTN
ncbi:MAG: hypothetical protein QM698_01355 [Micropepsaceae bacterium]